MGGFINMTNKAVVIAEQVGKGNTPELRHFNLTTTELNKDLHEGDVLLQTLFLSVDPYMRMRMNPDKSYMPPFTVGNPGEGSGVGRVIESSNNDYKVGDILTSQKDLSWPWQEFVKFDANKVVNFTKINQVPENLIPHTIGQLGMPGLTAYFGVLERGKPKEGETFVVSGAAGACGTIAGQIAKLKGLRVIGIAGGPEKVRYLTEELGFDVAIDYKGKSEEELIAELKIAAPKGIDVYYDNVGGIISNAILRLTNQDARVPICGQISQYNTEGSSLPEDIEAILKERNVDRQWFMVMTFKEKFDVAWQELFQWVQSGDIKVRATIFEGIEKLPEAFLALFLGTNTGKAVVKISQ